MGRRRGRIRKDITGAPDGQRLRSDIVLKQRDWDSDEIDPYTMAVDTVLEALEGIWMDIDDPGLEREVNDHIASIKEKIQKAI